MSPRTTIFRPPEVDWYVNSLIFNLLGMPAVTINDLHPPGGFSADARPEDLQVPPAAAGAAQVHGAGARGPRPRAGRHGGDEGHRHVHQRAKTTHGEHRENSALAEICGGLGGECGIFTCPGAGNKGIHINVRTHGIRTISPWTISPWTISPQDKIPPDNIPPFQYPPGQYPPG